MVTRAIDHKYGSWFTNSSSVLPTSLVVYQHFSNPLHVIIQAAHQSIILVTWMGLETQWKPSENTAVFETISITDANFLYLHIDKATKHAAINNFI